MGEHSHPRRRRKGVCPMQQHTHCWSALLQHTHEGPTRPLKSFWECPLSLELQAPCPQCSPRKRLGRKGLVFAIIASVWMCLNRKRTCSRRRERAAQGGLGFHIILIHRSPRLRQSQHSNTHLQHALATFATHCNTFATLAMCSHATRGASSGKDLQRTTFRKKDSQNKM